MWCDNDKRCRWALRIMVNPSPGIYINTFLPGGIVRWNNRFPVIVPEDNDSFIGIEIQEILFSYKYKPSKAIRTSLTELYRRRMNVKYSIICYWGREF
ncbi:MAG: hypothetical protein EOM73_05140 [Bacteroidia bacterium]|nr:hypothetical protein [Bacteroidia bacterium]